MSDDGITPRWVRTARCDILSAGQVHEEGRSLSHTLSSNSLISENERVSFE